VTSSGGSDANPCTQAQPCASFDRAYQVASPGQIVCVAPGNYGSQRISYVAGRTTPNVVIQGCGGSVSVLSLAVGANSGGTQPCCVTFKDMAITGSSSARAVFIYWGNKSPSSRAADITFDGVRIAVGQPTNGPIFEAFTTLRLTVKNSVIGPACCGNNAAGQSTGSPIGIRIGTADRVSLGWPTNTDTVIDNNLIQGITRSTSQWLSGFGPAPQSSCVNTGDVCHADAIQVYGATNLRITHNRLYHNEVQGIFLDSTDPFIDGVIEGNMIGDVMDDLVGGAGATAGISLDGRALAGTWSIANNTLATGEQISVVNTAQIPGGTTISVKGNVGNWRATSNTTGTSCTGGASVFSFAYNVWGGLNSTSTGCSSSDMTGVPAFVSAALSPNATMDLHLGSTGMADNLMAAGCIGSDLDGEARATRCEAGADER
jgi:hypothetical protein